MNLYFECAMGAAGDMLASALVGLFDDQNAVLDELNGLSLPHTQITYGEKTHCGVTGVHLNILIDGKAETPDTHHGTASHRSLQDVLAITEALTVSDAVKEDIRAVYTLVAEAEAKAHGTAAGEVHFHELGMLDAIADITVCAYLIRKLQPERIFCSPINVGSGTVQCAHGILPVPAPATANILTGVPYYQSEIPTELCTPTGAALLKYYVNDFVNEPNFGAVTKIGVGAGVKELTQANVVRVFAFEDTTVTELACNIDDMTGEEAAFAAERMMAEGALDCFITPVMMKKGRPAYLFTVLCQPTQAEQFAALIFKHTTTLGIRKYTPSRYTLDRTIEEQNGIHIKRAEGYGVCKEKAEFEDIRRLALEKDISVFEARQMIKETE